jgi:DNA polymerase-4
MDILLSFTPDIEQVSIDEAYMDVTGCLHFWDRDPRRMAVAMKEKIVRECGLSVSIGVAANRVCAKIAAGVHKPDGLVVVAPGAERAFLAPLPVEAIPGIGTKTAPKLHACGIRTVAQALARVEHRMQHSAHGTRNAESILCSRIASCVFPSDEPITARGQKEKSISRDRTFGEDTSDGSRLLATLYCLTERCCKTLRKDDLTASTVTVRVRSADFTTVQKQTTLALPSSNEEEIFAAARQMLASLHAPGRFVRLVGVKVSGLVDAGARQLTLDVVPSGKFDALHRRLDVLQSRYGEASIRWGITCGVAERRDEQ